MVWSRHHTEQERPRLWGCAQSICVRLCYCQLLVECFTPFLCCNETPVARRLLKNRGLYTPWIWRLGSPRAVAPASAQLLVRASWLSQDATGDITQQDRKRSQRAHYYNKVTPQIAHLSVNPSIHEMHQSAHEARTLMTQSPAEAPTFQHTQTIAWGVFSSYSRTR